MSKSAISSYEQDTRSPPPDILISIADLFHVSVDYLLGREQKLLLSNTDGLKKRDVELVETIIRFLSDQNHDDDENHGDDEKSRDDDKNHDDNGTLLT